MEDIGWRDTGEDSLTLTPNGLDAFYTVYDYDENEAVNGIFSASRTSTDAPFGSQARVESLEGDLRHPNLSADGNTIYFAERIVNEGAQPALYYEVYYASRPAPDAPFGEPNLLVPSPDGKDGINSPFVSADNLSLYMQYGHYVNGHIDSDLYVATRLSATEPWGSPGPIPGLPSEDRTYQGRPSVSPDHRALFYKSFEGLNRGASNGSGTGDLFVVTRGNVDEPWSDPVNLGDMINSATYDEDFARMSADGSTLYFKRSDRASDSREYVTTRDIWQSPVLPFETVELHGQGGLYQQDFDSMGTDSSEAGTPLPAGWTFTANDVVFSNSTTSAFPSGGKNWSLVYNAGNENDTDRALATDIEYRGEAGEIDLRTEIVNSDVQALRLTFDIEVWRVVSNNRKGEFQVVLEADAGTGFEQIADLGTFETEPLARDLSANGNDDDYRAVHDTGPVDVDIPEGSVLRTRWIATQDSRNVVLGLDNVTLQFALPGDANVDGLFDSVDFVSVFTAGEFEDGIAGNSTWSEGDWNNDQEFDSSDFVTAFQAGFYEQGRMASHSVPEPSSWLLVCIGGLLLSRRRNA